MSHKLNNKKRDSDKMFKFLERPIHTNLFAQSFQMTDEQKEHYQFSFDGAIVSVREDIISPYLNREDIKSMRFGYTPKPKKVELKVEEDLLFLLALLYVDVGIEEEAE